MQVGDRARFTGKFDDGYPNRNPGDVGTIVGDAALRPNGHNFGGGTCLWQSDGDPGVYVTALADLTLYEGKEWGC
jgi:hypothetical protein